MAARFSRRNEVFLNIPYDKSYEKLFVGLTAALLSVGCFPRLTFQVPDGGQGRLARIFRLLKSCRISIHELSSLGRPARFNMPFELGLACAIRQRQRHDFVVLERQPHRLDIHLSDLRGIDPKIHYGTVRGAICAVLEVLGRRSANMDTARVMKVYRRLMRYVPSLKRRHGRVDLYGARIYAELVALSLETAAEFGL